MIKSAIQTKIKDVDSKKGIVQFYTSIFDVKDADGDIIQKGAFTKTLSENSKRFRHLVDHRIAVGLPLDAKETDTGLLVTSQLFRGKQVADELLVEYMTYAEHEKAMEHSFGYEVIQEMYDKQRDANILKELKVWEFTTMTTWGANENALQVGVKSQKDLMFELDTLKNMLNSELTDNRLKEFERQYNRIEKLLQPSTQIEPGTTNTSELTYLLTQI